MFKINSYTDLKVAYEILEIAYESGRSQKAADLKREMRAFFPRPVSDGRIVQDDGSDGLVKAFAKADEVLRYMAEYQEKEAATQ